MIAPCPVDLALAKRPPNLETPKPRTKERLFRRCVLVCLVLQVLWALAIPIKNVLIIPYPKFRSDALSTSTEPYGGYDSSAKLSFTGLEVADLLVDVLRISFGNPQVRSILQQKSDFAIDDLGQVLSPSEHKTMAQYYTLVFQTSEFPGGVFTERQEKITRLEPNGTRQTYTIGCRSDQTLMGGTTCTDSQGLPCDDSAWFAQPRSITLKDVDFTSFLNGTGWQNNIGLLALVEYFHYYMRLVFAKKNWAAVVASENLDSGFGHLADDDSVLETAVMFNLALQSTREIATNSTMIWNCLASEVLLGEVYLSNYTLEMIQAALIEHRLFNASNLVPRSAIVTDRARAVLNGKIHITSGAGYAGSRDTVKYLGSAVMTHTSVSSVNIKRDRPMTGSQLFGSSMRNIMYMGYYPNSYYSVLKTFPNGSEFVFQSGALGGMFSGYNGFKFDFVHNTMTNFKLAERSVAAGTGYSVDWYAQEGAIADWFAAYELKQGSGNLIDMAIGRFGHAAANETACFQALFKRIAQASWLVLLQLHPITEHLAFSSVNAQSTPQVYFLKQMLKNEFVAENSYGYRIRRPFNPTNVSSAFGTAWPMVPVLSSLVLKHGSPRVASILLGVLNATFLQLVDFTAGGFDFHDTNHCPLTDAITASDSAESAYNKIYGPLALLVDDTLANVEILRLRMERELGQSIQVRGEYLNDTRVNSIFKYVGPPVFWTHSPLAVGLLRLSSKTSPDFAVATKIKESLVCYDVLETRYLNVSTRCWSEFGNVNETRAQYNSEGLRTLLLTAWSMGVVLNLFAAIVAISYACRMIRVARITGLPESWRTLLFLEVQEFGMSSYSKYTLMACSAAPFMFGYQLPQDTEYISNSSTYQLGSVYLDELMVSLGITWFIKLGTAIGMFMIRLRHKHASVGRSKLVVRALVFVGEYTTRILMVSADRDYNSAIFSLAVSCLLTALAGIVGIHVCFVFQKPSIGCDDEPAVPIALKAAGVLSNEMCVFSQNGTAWSHTRMVMHDWTCVTDGGTLVFTSATGDILVVVRDSRIDIQRLPPMNKTNFDALNMTLLSEPPPSGKSRRYTKLKVDLNVVEAPSTGLSCRIVLVTLVILMQALWAIVVPVRNVLLFPMPTFNYDNTSTTTASFAGFDQSSKLNFTGSEVLAVIQRALDISLTNPDVRGLFETSGEYSIDSLGQVLSPADHQVFAQLYAMVFQASEFPAGALTPREESIVRRNPDGTFHSYILGCRLKDAELRGAVCVDATGAPCTSANVAGATLTDVSPQALMNASSSIPGWRNNVALISVVDYFYSTMCQVFEKQDWSAVAATRRRSLGSVEFTLDGTLIETPEIFALASNTTDRFSRINNCLLTEVILSEAYIAEYTQWLIQTALVERNLYKATEVIQLKPFVQHRALDAVRSQVLFISSAAGYFSFHEKTHVLFTNAMTSSAISTTVIKGDLNLHNSDAMGSSVRHIWTLLADSNRHFSAQRIAPESNGALMVETRVLGGRNGGYLGFKDSMLLNTMGVYKLSERPCVHTKNNESLLEYFDEEAAIADWYASFEQDRRQPFNLLNRVTQHFGTIRVQYPHGIMTPVTTDEYETTCYQALMRRVSQIVWLTALRLHGSLQYLVFMADQNDISNHDWFLQQMMVNEVLGENAYGGRVHIPYNALFVSSNLGSGWPLIPLITALSQVYNQTQLHWEIMTEMNATLTSLIELEAGLVNFRDVPHCPIGHTTHGVTKDDSLDSMYAKVYPAFSGLVQDVIADIPHVQARFDSDLQLQVKVPLAYLDEPQPKSAAFPFHRAPVRWTHTPLAIGLMRLTTKESPYQFNVNLLKKSLVCYNTLDARDLTTSIRCWSETLSTSEVRAAYSSVTLRVVLFSTRFIGVMLNALGLLIAFRYVTNLRRMWKLTNFDLGNWELRLLLSTHIQSLGGTITIHETALMAFGSLALQFGYRMPQDPGLVFSTTSIRLPYFDELVICLGMSWAVHFGMELGSLAIHLRHKNRWFVAQNTQAKVLLVGVVYVLLTITRHYSSYDLAIGSLIAIWIFAVLSGFLSMTMSAVFDRPAAASKSDPTQGPAVTDSLGLTMAKVSLNQVGYLSQQNGRWSLLGIVLEGWRGVQTSPRSFLMARHNVLVHFSGGGAVEPTLCKEIGPADFTKLVHATMMMNQEVSVDPKTSSPRPTTSPPKGFCSG